MQCLIDHAYQRACLAKPERPPPGEVVEELAGLAAGDDAAAVHKAWDYCVQCYAEQEDLAWLRAATYLLPLELRYQRQHIEARRRQIQTRHQQGARKGRGHPDLH